MFRAMYDQMTVKQLKQKLRDKRLPVSGRKQQLIERLIESEKKESNNDDTKQGFNALQNLLISNAAEALKKENQLTQMETYKTQKYLNVVLNDNNMNTSQSESISTSPDKEQCTFHSIKEYMLFIEQKCKFWDNKLKDILSVNIGKTNTENLNTHYFRVCDEMETAIETAYNLFESTKLELQRTRENLLVFFAYFLGFSVKMYTFMKYLFEHPPGIKQWDSYRTYDFEIRKIKWVLSQKSISKTDAHLMKVSLETVWKDFDLYYDGNKEQFDGQSKSMIINNLFKRWR